MKTHSKYIESITQLEIEILGTQIRVWREETSFDGAVSDDTHLDLSAALTKFLKGKKHPSRIEIANALFEVDRVNAVEVKNSFGNGVVLYKDWP